MTVAEFRAELGLSYEDFAELLGFASKSSAHDIERSGKASPRVALKLERLSNGRIDAASLNDAVAATRAEAA